MHDQIVAYLRTLPQMQGCTDAELSHFAMAFIDFMEKRDWALGPIKYAA